MIIFKNKYHLRKVCIIQTRDPETQLDQGLCLPFGLTQ